MRVFQRVQYVVAAVLATFTLWAVAEQAGKDYSSAMIEVIEKAPEQPESVVEKSAEEWEQDLSPIEFHVLRKAGTEPANGKIYKQFKSQGEGVYYCSGCGAELFSSKEKFDSGSGWPSFYAASAEQNIKLDVDYKIGYKRVEIRCDKCDGHLGHVFEGEGHATPTDKRYCVNGVCLKFLPQEEKATESVEPESKK